MSVDSQSITNRTKKRGRIFAYGFGFGLKSCFGRSLKLTLYCDAIFALVTCATAKQ